MQVSCIDGRKASTCSSFTASQDVLTGSRMRRRAIGTQTSTVKTDDGFRVSSCSCYTTIPSSVKTVPPTYTNMVNVFINSTTVICPFYLYTSFVFFPPLYHYNWHINSVGFYRVQYNVLYSVHREMILTINFISISIISNISLWRGWILWWYKQS